MRTGLFPDWASLDVVPWRKYSKVTCVKVHSQPYFTSSLPPKFGEKIGNSCRRDKDIQMSHDEHLSPRLSCHSWDTYSAQTSTRKLWRQWLYKLVSYSRVCLGEPLMEASIEPVVRKHLYCLSSKPLAPMLRPQRKVAAWRHTIQK